ncbi:MAG TPA: hypothetical protein VMM92_05880, partial [Thermoanaerobaculia bacterium]|nr:hypothetical protein [Thermoanaerobaculia bacterium]
MRVRFTESKLFSPVFLLLPILLGSSSTLPPRPSLAEGAPSAAPVATPSPGQEPGRVYVQAAAALRQHDCSGAESLLAPLTVRPEATPRDRAFARLVYGLYAHACEQPGPAEEQLFAAPDPASPLEDWRLFILSDSAAADGHVLLAQAALAKLLGDYPESSLRPRAFVKLASLAWGQGNARRALESIARARKEPVRGEEGKGLESLAWEITRRTGDAAGQLEAARRLLTDWPAEAAQLHVADGLSWADLLSAAELKRRSDALLALDLAPNAIATLDAVRPADRDLDWSLRKALALTRNHQGADALR